MLASDLMTDGFPTLVISAPVEEAKYQKAMGPFERPLLIRTS